MDLRSLAFTIDFRNINDSAIVDMNNAMDELRDSMIGVSSDADSMGDAISDSVDSRVIELTGSAMDRLRDSVESATRETTLMGRVMDKLKQSAAGRMLARGMDSVRTSVERVRERLFGVNSAFERMRNSHIGERIAEGFSRLRGIIDTVASAAGRLGDRLRTSMNSFRDSISEAAKKLEELNPKMESLGKGMMTKVTAPVVAGIAASINEFAKLEQSIGGVETLFKDSASVVIANSETAYKRAGVSANDYMENITSFSASLLQGLGGDTERAAKVADIAMVDMSDNANKFGTDIGDVQNAYQGFAKDNYTMLDNLKLGYGGTKTEMERLLTDATKLSGVKYEMGNFADMIEAIHVVQTEMGVTGTTTLEAMETIGGSIGMAKASLQDFLGGLGNSDADVSQLTKNLVESFKAVVVNIKGVLATIWDNIPLAGWQKNIIAFAVAFGPAVFVLSKLIGFLLGIPAMIGTIGTVFGIITGPIGITVGLIAGLIAVIVHLWKTNETFRDVVIGIWESIKTTLGNALEYIKGLWETHGDSIKTTVMNVFDIIKNVILIALTVILGVITVVLGIIKLLWAGFGETIIGIISGAWSFIQGIIEGVMNFIQGIIDVGLGIIQGDWDRVFNGLVSILDGAVGIIKSLWQGAIDLLTLPIDAVVNLLDAVFKDKLEGVKKAWNGLKDFLKNPISGVVNLFRRDSGGKVDGSHASGAYNIPFDGYLGELHKGEMVLTKSASDIYRAMGGTENKVPDVPATNNYSTSTTTIRSGNEGKSGGNPVVFSPTIHVVVNSGSEEELQMSTREIEKHFDKWLENYLYKQSLKMQ